MPAPYAHLKISDLSVNRFCASDQVVPELKSYAEKFSRYIHLGSAAPDYPYLDAPIEHDQKLWADHMHYHHTGDFLKCMAEKLVHDYSSGISRDDFIIPFCWILGYVSHVTADLVVHPVVQRIVGEYTGHEPEHKECEMIQDAYIYHELTGRDIEDSVLIEELENFSDPEGGDDISPIIKELWDDLFERYFPDEYTYVPPRIHAWHDKFTSLLKERGWLQKFGRFFGVTYERFAETSRIDKSYYLNRIHSPFGTQCSYDEVFNKAVNRVSERWELLALAMAGNDPKIFTGKILNYNLDDGKDEREQLVFWQTTGENEFA